MKKRLLSLLLALAMIVTLIPGSEAKAATGSYKKIIGTARFGSDTYTTTDYNLTYYYDDAYFAKSAFEKNISLATMSMVAAMAAGRSNEADVANKSKNIKKLWQDCGFSKIEVNQDFKREATMTSSAMGCASKKLTVDDESYTLISLAISGLRITHEWGGVYYLGRTGDAQTLREGADSAYTFLKNYISNNGIKGKVKVWLTGYGIAGSKVNLLAADLDNGKSLGKGVTLSPEDMYAFCFEAPAATLRSNGVAAGKYKNIFVYNNPYDFITHFAPSRFDFDSYGVLTEYPTRQEDSNYASKRDKMIRMLRTINGAPNYMFDNFRNKEFSLFGGEGNMKDSDTDLDANKYLDVAVDALILSCAANRDVYVRDFQDDMANVMDFIFGTDDPNWYKVTGYFGQEITDNILLVGLDILLGNESSLANKYEDYAYTAMSKAGVSADSSRVKIFASTLAKVAVKYAKSYTNYSVTLFANFDILITGPEATFNLAWLESMDPNYKEDGKNIAFCTATPSETKYIYTGNALTPTAVVKNGSTTLTKGVDYKLTYQNNTDIGTGYIVITGIGDYTGTLKVPFTIVPDKTSLSLSNVSSGIKVEWEPVVGAGGYYIYRKAGSETAWKKVKTVSDGDAMTWTDKSVSHNKKYTYSIIAYGDGQKGSRSASEVYYYLKKTTLSSVKSSAKKKLTAKWKSSSSVTGYQIWYSYDQSFNFNTRGFKNFGKKTLSITIKGLKSKKYYYAKVRSIKKVDGVSYYGAWSSVKKVKVK